MHRREWLKLSLATSAAVAALAALGRGIRDVLRERNTSRALSEWQQRVRDDVHRRLSGYELDSGAVARYLDDAERYRVFLVDPSSRRVDLAARFLLSTDFFENGADPARPARYVRFFHPWVAPCTSVPVDGSRQGDVAPK